MMRRPDAMLPLNACPALVLNADYQPLSYYPLSVWNWQEAVKAIFLDRVAVVSHYDRVIRSPGFEMQLPSVVALKQYVPQDRRPPFTRFNVFLRDRFSLPVLPQGLPGERADLRPPGPPLARRAGRAGPTSSPPAPAATCARATACRTSAGCSR